MALSGASTLNAMMDTTTAAMQNTRVRFRFASAVNAACSSAATVL